MFLQATSRDIKNSTVVDQLNIEYCDIQLPVTYPFLGENSQFGTHLHTIIIRHLPVACPQDVNCWMTRVPGMGHSGPEKNR